MSRGSFSNRFKFLLNIKELPFLTRVGCSRERVIATEVSKKSLGGGWLTKFECSRVEKMKRGRNNG